MKNHLIFLLPFIWILSQCNHKKSTRTPQTKELHQTANPIVIPEFEDREKAEWLVKQVYKKVSNNYTPITEAQMKPYTETISSANSELATKVKFKMIPIPSGSFTMGAMTNESYHTSDQSPAHTVHIDAFWMADSETTWAMFNDFLYNNLSRKSNGIPHSFHKHLSFEEMLTQPSSPYIDFTRNGTHSTDDNYPAMCMTNHMANQFCQWLSYKTGRFYRLPTEAEWEYAARAGTSTRFPWGDSPKQSSKYAWLQESSSLCYPTFKEVKLKSPNAWGLYDMLGNVSEWTADQYDNSYYSRSSVRNPFNFPTKRYPRTIRGGSYLTPIRKLSSAFREKSSKDLKMLDPQIPKSIWHHTYAQHIGFRVISPLRLPTQLEMFQFWNSDQWNEAKNAEDLVTK